MADHREMARNRSATAGISPFTIPDPARRAPEATEPVASRRAAPIHAEEYRPTQTPITPSRSRMRGGMSSSGGEHASARRDRPYSETADVDFTQVESEEYVRSYYRRSGGDPYEDQERALAAMRGAIAASKKVPSKEAIASLLKMTTEEVQAEGEDISMLSALLPTFLY